jgi:hypothetical protein
MRSPALAGMLAVLSLTHAALADETISLAPPVPASGVPEQAPALGAPPADVAIGPTSVGGFPPPPVLEPAAAPLPAMAEPIFAVPLTYGNGGPEPFAIRGLAPSGVSAFMATEGMAAQCFTGTERQGYAAMNYGVAPQVFDPAPVIVGNDPAAIVPYGATYGAVGRQNEYYASGTNAGVTGVAPTILPATKPGVVLYRNHWYLDSAQLLPAVNDQNDLFHAQLDAAQTRLGKGFSPAAAASIPGMPELLEDVWARFKAMPSFGMAYDTGAFETDSGSFDVPNIALGADPAAGQTSFSGGGNLQDVPLQLLGDGQITSLDLPGAQDQQVQLYVQADNYEDPERIRTSQLFGRVWDKDRLTIGAGQSYSLFSVSGNLPNQLAQGTRPIGAGALEGNNPKQLRMQLTPPKGGGWGGGVAIEEGFDSDAVYAADAEALTRWPTLASNFVYAGANNVDRLQLSSVVRTLGFEATDAAEFFATGWGVAAFARWGVITEPDLLEGFYIGAAGGRGIGAYIHGVSNSVVFDNGSLQELTGAGAYVGHQLRWISARGSEFGSNMAYGYAQMDAEGFMADDTNRQLHQAWANFMFYPNKHVAVGTEYQYGSRETLRDGHGENHRVLLIVALTSAATGAAEGVYQTKYDQPYVEAKGARVSEAEVGAIYSSAPGGDASRQAF